MQLYGRHLMRVKLPNNMIYITYQTETVSRHVVIADSEDIFLISTL